jgi:hypothetical protein
MKLRADYREAWKARKKLRLAVGWLAVLMGLAGLVLIVFAIGIVYAWVEGSPTRPLEPLMFLSLGGALLACGFGLWNAKPWARWVVIALCCVSVWLALLQLARGEAPGWRVLVDLGVAVYLLLPSTARHFARAQTLDVAPARR